MDDIRTYLVNLPTHIPGMSAVDEDGEPMVYRNARLTDARHRRTRDHEMEHIRRDDFYNDTHLDEVGRIASGKQLSPQGTPSAPMQNVAVAPPRPSYELRRAYPSVELRYIGNTKG